MTWLTQLNNPAPPPLDLPLRFADARLAGLPDGTLKEKVADYLTEFAQVAPQGIGCLFVGRARGWKTYAAAVIARHVNHWAKIDVLFVQCAVLAAELERNRFAESTANYLDRVKHTSLVVMDDFSQIPERTFAATVLTEIAEYRFANLRPTVWTANVSGTGIEQVMQSIAQLYGAGFSRRVHDGTEGFRVRVG